MSLTIAAIRSGTEPVGELPPGSFHRWLDDAILCPKCDAAYNLVVAWDQAASRFFAEESRSLITKLRKAVFMGHGDGHRVSHFETSGVVVKSMTAAKSAAVATHAAVSLERGRVHPSAADDAAEVGEQSAARKPRYLM